MQTQEFLPYFGLSIPLASVRDFGRRVLDAQHILIVSHRNPDGDTIGAGCALWHVLQALGKEVTLFCVDEVPKNLRWLPASRHYSRELPYKTPDLILVVDTNSFENTGIANYLQKHNKDIFIIDHHTYHTPIVSQKIIIPESCSTTGLLYSMFQLLRIPICLDTATALLEGIYWDTGGLQHSNTNYHSYHTASMLIKHGANHKEIVQHIFRHQPTNQLKLWGIILDRARQHETYPITYSFVHDGDFATTNTAKEDSNGVIDLLNSVPKQWCSILFIHSQNTLRVSLRSRQEDIDVSLLAQKFGGGGHKKAAGFTIPLESLPQLSRQS